MKNLNFDGKAIFITGVFLLLYAVWHVIDARDFILQSDSTTGVVIDFHQVQGDESTTYAPVVKFRGPDNRNYEFRSDSSSNPKAYNIGEIVEVIYLTDAPGYAKINSFWEIWGVATFFAVMGLLFTLGQTSGLLKEKD